VVCLRPNAFEASTECRSTLSHASLLATTMWAVASTSEEPIDQMCRSWICTTPSMLSSFLVSWSCSMCAGAFIINVSMVRSNVPFVVNKTRMPNNTVQHGSA